MRLMRAKEKRPSSLGFLTTSRDLRVHTTPNRGPDPMNRRILQALYLTALIALTLAAAPKDRVPYSRAAAKKDYLRPASLPQPAGNQGTAERVLLGKTLFFDPRLSGSEWISCASCHNPGFG